MQTARKGGVYLRVCMFVRVFYGLELLRYIHRCAIERTTALVMNKVYCFVVVVILLAWLQS